MENKQRVVFAFVEAEKVSFLPCFLLYSVFLFILQALHVRNGPYKSPLRLYVVRNVRIGFKPWCCWESVISHLKQQSLRITLSVFYAMFPPSFGSCCSCTILCLQGSDDVQHELQSSMDTLCDRYTGLSNFSAGVLLKSLENAGT